jgi:hypothetical protein
MIMGIWKAFNDKCTFKKLAKAFDPTDNTISYNDDALDISTLFGAVDTNKFMDLRQSTSTTGSINETIKTGFIGGKAISEKVVDELAGVEPQAFLGKAQEFFWNSVGSVGSATEGTARYVTFKDISESMIEHSPVLAKRFKKEGEGFYKSILEDIKNIEHLEAESVAAHASEIMKDIKKADAKLLEVSSARKIFQDASDKTNSVFFDYENVTAFEKHVMKRIFPYWTFFSRNFQQWLEHGLDADNIGRVAKIIKPGQNLGRPLTQEERIETPDWLLEKGARVGSDANGNMNFVFQPNLSIFDAINTVQDPGGSFLGKLSPVLKFAGENIVNREAFGRDVPVRPTESKPKKRVLDSAFTGLAEVLPFDILENLGIYRDENGKMFTNNPYTSSLLKSEDLLPVPQIGSQLARTHRDIKFKDKSLAEASLNLFPVLRTFEMDAQQLGRQGDVTRRNIERFKGGKDELINSGGKRRRRRRRRRRRKK